MDTSVGIRRSWIRPLSHCKSQRQSNKRGVAVENGPFWDQKGVKEGLKTRFSKNDPTQIVMVKQAK